MEEDSLDIDLITSKSSNAFKSNSDELSKKDGQSELDFPEDSKNGKIEELKALERKNTSQGIQR